MQKVYSKVSFSSRVVNYLIKFTNYKKSSLTIENAKKYIKKIKKKNFDGKYNLKKEIEIDSKLKLYSYNGTLDEPVSGGILIYIHGGSYIEDATRMQIKFAKKLAAQTNTTLIFCDYPLAPYSNAKEMFRLFDKMYDLLLKKNININILGDSAGGGFAIAFDRYLYLNNKPLPTNVITLSPWLDVSMSNNNIYDAARLDNMCGVDGTRYMGKLWADDIDTKSELISPLYADFSNIENITIVTGEYDILKYQCSEFHEKLNKNNINHNYFYYEKQGHIFAVLPIKESKIVLKDMKNILK